MTSLLAIAVVSVAPLVLQRGADVDQEFRYWAVEDTYLDRQLPDQNFGRDRSLLGGPDKMILIRFGELRRVVPTGQRVKSATLILGVELGTEISLREVRRVSVDWGEGGGSRSTLFARSQQESKWNASTWRQRHGGSNAVPWGSPGATGTGDSRLIPGATNVQQANQLRIEGLSESLQAMLDRPDENFGWALVFDRPCGFASSEAVSARPQLALELEPEQGGKQDTVDLMVSDLRTNLSPSSRPSGGGTFRATAKVVNKGRSPCNGFRARWTIASRPGAWIESSTNLTPGQSVEVGVDVPAKLSDSDPRSLPIVLRVEPLGLTEDPTPWDNADRVEAGGLAATIQVHPSEFDLLRAAIHFLNDVALPQSQFSFAPEGALERLRLDELTVDATEPKRSTMRAWLVELGRRLGLIASLDQTTAPAVGGSVPLRRPSDMYPGFMGSGDTREESNLPGGYNLTYDGSFDALIESMDLQVTDLLSATDVAALQAMLGKNGDERVYPWRNMPAVVGVRAMDRGGRPLKGATLEFYMVGEAEPFFRADTNATHVVTLPNRPSALGEPSIFGNTDYRKALIGVRATKAGTSDIAWIKPWHLMDVFSRGSKGAGILDLRFNLTDLPLVEGSDLAKDRLVTDSRDRSPGLLAALVDDDPQTILEWSGKEGDWLELDLARDRLFGEVRLRLAGGNIDRFDWMVFGTGQSPTEAAPWVRERHGDFTARVSTSDELIYRGPAVRARYLRLMLRGPCQDVRIAGIRVVSAREP